jgi:PAS domain S-box-containing protein
MASSEILLIDVGGGWLALHSPGFALPAVVCVLLLARFRGRVQALIGASAFSLFGLWSIATGHPFPEEFTRNGPFVAALGAIWCCAFLASPSRSDRAAAHSSTNPFEVRPDELSKYVWSRNVDGTIEYVSPDGWEHLGVSPNDVGDFTRYIHPEDVDCLQRAMDRAKQTGEPQQCRARYLSATGEYHWFATLLHTQKDSTSKVIRYFRLLWNIDEEKRKEDEMLARDGVWGTLLKIFPGWMWVARPDGTPEFLSQAAEEYSGLSFEEVLKDGLQAIHPDDRQHQIELWNQLINTEQPGEMETRIRGADGKYRWFLSRFYPMRDANGKLERWVSISLDIDERKKAEEERRGKEELFRRIADGVPACICIMSPDGAMVYANKVASTALGKPVDNILGNQWMQHIHPEQYDEGYQSWMYCVANKTPFDTRWLMLQHDGEYRWQHILADPSFDENGNVVSWYMMSVEIDQQVKAEQALQSREREARELLNRVPAMLAIRGKSGIEFVSERFLNHIGLPASAVLGYKWLQIAHPEDRAHVSELFAESIRTGQPSEWLWRIADKNGHYRWFHTRSEPFLEQDGSIRRWYSATTDIDDLLRSKEAIRDHRMQLDLLAEGVPGFLWKALPNGEVTYLNYYCEEYLGLTFDQVSKTGWIRLIHPEDREEVMRRWNILVDGRQWREHVHRLIGKDGNYRWFQSLIATVKDEGGKVVALHGLLMDAHTIVSSQQTIRQEQKRLRRFVDAMPAMIWRADPGGRIAQWNRTMIDTIGKPWETSESFDLMSKIDPDQALAVDDRWQRSVRLGVPYEDTYRILANDGIYHWHLVRALPFRDEQGTIISWYGIHTDIDALKEIERELQAREHELQGIIETIPSMFWSASPDGEIVHINKRVREYSGLSLEDFCDLGWEKYLHPADFEETAKAYFRSIQTGESLSTIHRLRRADGEYRWHHSRGEPLRNPEDKIIQWYGLSIDIDERKRAEDRLRVTRAKLNRASRIATVAELSASIAHELNQPLMAVLANAQATKRWLAAAPPNIEEAVTSIDRVIRDSRGADETMKHIRALFRRDPFEKKEASLFEIVNEAVRLAQEDPTKRRVTVESEIGKELPKISVDPIQVQEVLINLITNAMEAMEGSPRDPRLIIRATADRREMSIQVIDNGSGVDDPETIFEPFFSTKKEGMGIGLAVARSIVEAHEGQLWAENNPDFGARFTLRLPLAKNA